MRIELFPSSKVFVRKTHRGHVVMLRIDAETVLTHHVGFCETDEAGAKRLASRVRSARVIDTAHWRTPTTA